MIRESGQLLQKGTAGSSEARIWARAVFWDLGGNCVCQVRLNWAVKPRPWRNWAPHAGFAGIRARRRRPLSTTGDATPPPPPPPPAIHTHHAPHRRPPLARRSHPPQDRHPRRRLVRHHVRQDRPGHRLLLQAPQGPQARQREGRRHQGPVLPGQERFRRARRRHAWCPLPHRLHDRLQHAPQAPQARPPLDVFGPRDA